MCAFGFGSFNFDNRMNNVLAKNKKKTTTSF